MDGTTFQSITSSVWARVGSLFSALKSIRSFSLGSTISALQDVQYRAAMSFCASQDGQGLLVHR